MDQDQFGGRTDDDLFADDIEPVSYEGEAVDPPPATTFKPESAEVSQQPAAEVIPDPPVRAQLGGLAQSRHNYPDRSRASNNKSNDNRSFTKVPPASAPSNTTSTPANAPSGPKSYVHRGKLKPNNNTAAASDIRTLSGGMQRSRMSQAESDKMMEEKRLASVEKERKFQRIKQDEEEHAIAVAKGEEEALKRKQEEAAGLRKRKPRDAPKPKPAPVERNKYDADRMQNKGRKGTRAPWDQDKVDLDQAAAFRKGANREVKGSTGSGLGASRYASQEPSREHVDQESDAFGKHNSRQNKQGRTLFEADDAYRQKQEAFRQNKGGHQPSAVSQPLTTKSSQKPKPTEDFPVLPSSGPTATNTVISPSWVKPVGDWAEDVEG
ncbi:hypothetical protein QC764_404760 [Podospora pseudoanserina]|uniref:Uncharacterized protein n=1 Tax=Podospora pseudoanserina TaxID=2609844 RepID=A0ABR0IAU4_9PEZI|nr:hypothetical protein QC764_404760 [Podospora pseudoanserina]